MYRTHTCGELRIENAGQTIELAGWIQTIRKFGAITFIDLRDRYGITQLLFGENLNAELDAQPLGREFVLRIKGNVAERSNKNKNISTGDVEILVSEFKILNKSAVPPFTIQDDTDGGDDLRMKYRYLDLRRNAVKKNLELRYAVSRSARNYLHENDFYDIETPFLIKSTPEGARDFVVPSRMNAGEFYALPQSPQTFKQLLMVSGYDRYYQIVKCFRDEDLRADRQPEFTQIDCEMAFVEQEDIINMFEGLVKRIFKDVKGIDYTERVERISWEDAMWNYGNDKPDTRFEMKITNFKKPVSVYTNKTTNNALIDNANFVVFDAAETVLAIGVANCSEYTRKQTDELTEWVKRPQIGMKGLAFIKVNSDGSYKSSIDKFYDAERLKAIADAARAKAGDLILILAGNEERTRKAMSELRLEMAKRTHKRDFKFGLEILPRKKQLQSNNPIYSLEISSEKIKNNRDKLLLIAKNESLSNASALQFFEFKNGDVINWTKTTLNQNTDKFKNIVQFRNYYVEGEKKQRTGHKFFIFIEGEHQAFKIINKIRKEIGEQFELSSIKDFKLLWVLDFPLFEYDEESNRWVARHHPFTSPKPNDIEVMINNDPSIKDASKYLEHPYANIKANAYDIVLNGNEIGGGSIRIYQRELQEKMFAALGMTKEEAQHKFGFLLGAFEYGAPPHGGIAFGFDRLCAILGGSESIRDFIAFPKNNSGRDVMIDAPSKIDAKQLEELNIKLDLK